MTRRLFPKALMFAALVAASLGSSAALARQGEAGPSIIITAKSAGELINDLRVVAGFVLRADDPQAGPALGMLDSLKNPEALQGLDPSKPLGAFASIPEGQGDMPSLVIFLPVLNGQKLLDALGGIGAAVEADNSSPGFTHKVTLPNMPFPLFVTQGGGYLYMSLAPVNADGLKAMKPATLLPKRAGAGDLSMTVRLDRMPASFREGFNNGLETSLAAQRDKKPGESDFEHQARVDFLKVWQDAFVALVRDGKELSLDLVIDAKTEFFGLELNSSAIPGSEYGKALRKLGAMKTKFKGMTANAAMGGYLAIPVTQGLRELMGKSFDFGIEQAKKDPKANAAAQQIIDELAPALRDVLTSETVDLGVAVQGPSTGSQPSYSLTGAVAVKGGKKFDKILRDVAKEVPAAEKANVKLDFAKTADGTAIHKMSDAKADAGPFGEAVMFAAAREDVVAFSMGKNGQAALNTALAGSKAPAASSGTANAQMEVFISASKLANMSKEDAERKAMTDAAAQVFTGAAARKDKLSMVLRAQGDSMSLRAGMDLPTLKFFMLVNEITKK